MVMVPFSGSGLMRISSSLKSPRREESVTLRNLNLSRASLALLEMASIRHQISVHNLEAEEDINQPGP